MNYNNQTMYNKRHNGSCRSVHGARRRGNRAFCGLSKANPAVA